MMNVDTSYLLDFGFPDAFNKNSHISIHPIISFDGTIYWP